MVGKTRPKRLTITNYPSQKPGLFVIADGSRMSYTLVCEAAAKMAAASQTIAKIAVPRRAGNPL